MRPQSIHVFCLLGGQLACLTLAGCSGNRLRTNATQTSAVATIPDRGQPTLAVVPVSVQDRDAVLIERISRSFSTTWSREASGNHLPVIPDSGQPFDAVRTAADEIRRTGRWGEETVKRFAEVSDCDYALLLWVQNYGFGWEKMDQTKEIRLGFLLASTQTGKAYITGQGETVASGRRESFDALEKELVSQTVEAVIGLLVQPDEES